MRSEATSEFLVVGIPDEFFTELLPEIRDLGELKILLHLFHLGAIRGAPAVPLEALLAPPVTRSVVTDQAPAPAPERLQAHLHRAIANGTVLRLTLRAAGRDAVLLLPSTVRNRELIAQLATNPQAAPALGIPGQLDVSQYRPNVFAFYERHIGSLTPLVAEQLRDAERSYPRAWIESAILEAELLNKRYWRYIQSILTQWEEHGAPDDVDTR